MFHVYSKLGLSRFQPSVIINILMNRNYVVLNLLSSPRVFFVVLRSQVRRAAEAVQRLCQCSSEKCSKLKVRKVGEGRYHIAGRNVFVRVSDEHFVCESCLKMYTFLCRSF